jgi:polyhydroxybutyrate depolymerase
VKRILAALTLLAVALAAGGCAAIRAYAAGATTHRIVSGGRTRTFLVYAPAGRGGPMPVVLLLHGSTGDGAGMLGLTGFDRVADADGFIAVYPDGYRRSWADGRGVSPADQAGVDDVAFLGAVLDDVDAHYPADRSRTYVTGISNGAMMAHRLGCDLAGRITAIAPDAGGMSVATSLACHPSRPVPVLDIQGTADPLVPYGGGEVTVPGTGAQRGPLLSAPDTAAAWNRLDGCAGGPVSSRVPDSADDGTTTSIQRWCGGEVELYTVTGGGHTWPGGVQYLPAAIVGRTARDFDASTVIGAFFEAHR